MTSTTKLDRDRLHRLIERERNRLDRSAAQSRRCFDESRPLLAGGVTSSFQARDPYPIYMADGQGAKLTDVDGNEYVDFHMGFGAMIIGHAHPRIQEVLRRRAGSATHLGTPMTDSIPVAAELERRFGFPSWRFCNTGTEATMAAVRLARAATGREVIVKVVGAYHGHHDPVLFSAKEGLPDIESAARNGLARSESTIQVPFNDATAVERVIASRPGEVACVIVELPMLAPFPGLPEPGYVEALRRVTRESDVLLILDEVKTGIALAPGGASELYGAGADIVTVAKALGGGLPTAAIGATSELFENVVENHPPIYGTFNANPLSMATAVATLTEILDASAYTHFSEIGGYLGDRSREVVEATRLPVNVVDIGAKGGLVITADPTTDHGEWQARHDAELTELLWLFQVNRGVYMSPAPRMHWTLSVAHEREDMDLFAENLAAAGEELIG